MYINWHCIANLIQSFINISFSSCHCVYGYSIQFLYLNVHISGNIWYQLFSDSSYLICGQNIICILHNDNSFVFGVQVNQYKKSTSTWFNAANILSVKFLSHSSTINISNDQANSLNFSVNDLCVVTVIGWMSFFLADNSQASTHNARLIVFFISFKQSKLWVAINVLTHHCWASLTIAKLFQAQVFISINQQCCFLRISVTYSCSGRRIISSFRFQSIRFGVAVAVVILDISSTIGK